MLSQEDLQRAITVAAEGSLGAVVSRVAFQRTPEGWKPRPGCLTHGYSSGEAIICAILLCFYFEMHGRDSDVVVIPEDREFTNYSTDLIWSGAWYFVQAVNRLSEKTAWEAIKMLLPETTAAATTNNRHKIKVAAAESDVEQRIISLAKYVDADPSKVGVLSTGEAIAMALLFNKMEWLPEGYTDPLDAINRLGDRWLAAVRVVRETGW